MQKVNLLKKWDELRRAVHALIGSTLVNVGANATSAKYALDEFEAEIGSAYFANLQPQPAHKPVAELDVDVDEIGPTLTFTPILDWQLQKGAHRLYTSPPDTTALLQLALNALEPRPGMPEPEHESLQQAAITAIKKHLGFT